MALWKLENSLELVICALCLDYERRRAAIEGRTHSKRTDTEFRYYNFKIYDAAAEIVGERFAEQYVREIGERIGFAGSEVNCVSEVTYKKYKRLIKENIAKKLHLSD